MFNEPLRLFAIFLGGSHPRATIELHDIQFVVAQAIEDTYPLLQERWWGRPGSLHIDATAEIDVVDGYRVRPVPEHEAVGDGVSLYFVNTGGYKPGVFGELHAYSFHVGVDKPAVWRAAKARAEGMGQLHQDNFDSIDDIVCIDDALSELRCRLRFDPVPGAPDRIDIKASYRKLPA